MEVIGYISSTIICTIFYLSFVKIVTLILRTRKLVFNVASGDTNQKGLAEMLKKFSKILLVAICILIVVNVFIYIIAGIYGLIVSAVIFIFFVLNEIKMQKFVNKSNNEFTDIFRDALKKDYVEPIEVVYEVEQNNVAKRGIRFVIPNEWASVLNDILEGIDCSKYTWITGSQEVHLKNNKFLFESEIINGDILEILIKEKEYYPVFLDLEAFSKDEEVHKLNTYQEFEESKCELILRICDCKYVDIYVKNEDFLTIIYNNAVKHSYEGIEYIDSNNDSRTMICGL